MKDESDIANGLNYCTERVSLITVDFCFVNVFECAASYD